MSEPRPIPDWLTDYERNWIDGYDTAEIWKRFNEELDKRFAAAQAYIDRILSHDPNGGQLMFLSRVRDILAGTDDGKEVNDG
ncbi:MAG: hypothetical protein E6Q97_22340 [Desulfurellales bacterium]|nr:MAG: hypothetical protein E6Q97_22340 [Desulfurellales bacterium]